MITLPEEVAQIPKADTPATLPCSSQIALRTSWGIPYDELTEEGKTQAWLQMVLCVMQAPPESGRFCHCISFWDIPEGQKRRETALGGCA